jgi:glycosyltransferase involved in cell wall biosynthesis
MRSTIDLSVIIPLHNGKAFIRRAISSIKQASIEIEIIIVENGSTDGSAEYVRKNFPSSNLILSKEVSNSQARNVGAAAATNEVITFLDQDDEFCKERIDREYLSIAKNGGVVIGTQSFLNEESHLMPQNLQNSPNSHLPQYYPLGMLITKQTFSDVGGFSPAYHLAEDLEFLTRLRRMSIPITFVEKAFLIRHFHEDNESHKVGEARSEVFKLLRSNIQSTRTED